jgi:D-arabinose 1-dehydrogenase-like Zn-dependent alcohol dehydrogenase
MQYVRPRGTIVAVGLPPGCMNADMFTIVLRNITIKGSYVGNRYETEAALEIASRSGIIAPYKLLDARELPKVYERMDKGMKSVYPKGYMLTLYRRNGREGCSSHFWR